MNRQFRCICAFMLAFGLTSSLQAQDEVTTQSQAKIAWTQYSSEWRKRALAAPANTLEAVKRIQNQYAGDIEQAEYHLLLAEINAHLVMFENTLANTQKGLALISAYEQPWLYHHLKLYEAESYDQLGDAKKGSDIVDASLKWAKQQTDKNLLIRAHTVRGILHLTLGQNESAMANFQAAYDISIKFPVETEPETLVYYIGYVYEYTYQDNLALAQYQKVVDFHRDGQNKIVYVKALYSLGRSYKNIGELEKGAQLLRAAAAAAESIGLMQYSAYANKEMSGYYLLKKEPDNAIRVLEKARVLFEQSNNPYMLMDVNFTLGRVGLQKRDLDMAKTYLNKAQEYIQDESMIPHQLSLDYAKAHLLSLEGDNTQAYQAMTTLYRDYRKYTREQNVAKLHELTTLYELDKKEVHNELLLKESDIQQLIIKQQRANYLFAVVGFSVIVLVLILLFLNSKRNQKRLEDLNNTDMLTGLCSRAYCLSQLESEIKGGHRYNYPTTLVSVDLDYFKQINDQFGHAVGDEVLQEFGKLCKKHFRKTDILGRVGGEEFLFCFTHTNLKDSVDILNKFRVNLKQSEQILSLTGSELTLSAGVIEVDCKQDMQDTLIELDSLLYQSKHNGRDQISTR